MPGQARDNDRLRDLNSNILAVGPPHCATAPAKQAGCLDPNYNPVALLTGVLFIPACMLFIRHCVTSLLTGKNPGACIS